MHKFVETKFSQCHFAELHVSRSRLSDLNSLILTRIHFLSFFRSKTSSSPVFSPWVSWVFDLAHFNSLFGQATCLISEHIISNKAFNFLLTQVREMDGLPLILDQTNIDARNPCILGYKYLHMTSSKHLWKHPIKKNCIQLSENQNGNGAFRLIRISSTVTANELLHPFLFWMRGVVFVIYEKWHELFQPP